MRIKHVVFFTELYDEVKDLYNDVVDAFMQLHTLTEVNILSFHGLYHRYDMLYEELDMYTHEGLLQPWSFRQYNTKFIGGDDWEDRDMYAKCIMYLFDLAPCSIPNRYIFE